ncbi:MAG: hypothetical protein B6D37_08535 [Sphingobacteriales bacterium UTBCD1]|jgi:LEA14-like dessication related protein|nr:MAG: hypothetical protein B6D37_08535 [Sphingobacteriales bacterium UTBCD1]
MNKKKNILPYRLISLTFPVITIILFSCSTIKEPVFNGIDDLRLNEMGVNASTLSLRLNYFNPNHSGIKLKNAEGDAWVNQALLGHFKMDTTVNIPGRSDFTLPVKLEIDMKNALKNATALLFSKEINLKINGKAKIGKGGVFINYPILYEGKQDITKLMK